MPQDDLYHDLVRDALIQDGWTITDDPLWLSYGRRNVYADFGAERLIGAEKDSRRILVEIKSFTKPSEIYELEIAIGQYNLYRDILSENEPERIPYLAVPKRTYHSIFSEMLGQLVLRRQQLALLVFDEQHGGIVQWMPKP